MMPPQRLVFFSLPASGHIHPTLGLMRGLVENGCEVLYYANADFKTLVESTGATFRDYGEVPYDSRRPDRDMIRLSLGLLRVADFILPKLEAELANEHFSAVLYDAYAPWGRFFAERRKIRNLAFIPTFAFNDKVVARYSSPIRLLAQGLRSLPGLLAHLYESFSVKRRYRVRGTGLLKIFAEPAERQLVFTSRTFQPEEKSFDASYRFVGPILEGRKDSDALPAEHSQKIQNAKNAGKRVVLISLGTLYNHRLDFFHSCLSSFRHFDGLVILSAGHLISDVDFDHLIRLASENFLIRRRVPQLDILQKADLFLSHAGMNSASESLYFGVPLLLYPQMDEQRMVAERVAELGAGLILKEAEVRGMRIAAKAEAILKNSEFRLKAQTIGSELKKAGGAEQGIREILDFLGPPQKLRFWEPPQAL
ncbi:MAG: hypothetical protein JNM63_06615 [Spirochaetia bacterium]|nr:hypothetical protein [Spirochaetia bacterium]